MYIFLTIIKLAGDLGGRRKTERSITAFRDSFSIYAQLWNVVVFFTCPACSMVGPKTVAKLCRDILFCASS